MSTHNEQELSRAIREVIKRASVDAGFRAKAISNPAAALAEVSGSGSIAGDVKVQFVDDHASGTRTIVLPDPVVNADEIPEEELEQVAGGCFITTCNQGSCVNTN